MCGGPNPSNFVGRTDRDRGINTDRDRDRDRDRQRKTQKEIKKRPVAKQNAGNNPFQKTII